MNKSELMPCPFCGGKNVETSYKDTFSGDFRRGVYCADCCGGIYPYYSTEAEAIKAWNKRVKRYPESLAQRMIADGYEYELFELRKELDDVKIMLPKIVRCEDCVNHSFDEFGVGWCSENCREVKPCDYCVWGDRK